MQNTMKMPTYEELVGLSNGDLTERTRQALWQLIKYDTRSSGFIEARHIYEAYCGEREKRLLLGKVMHRKH